MLWLQAAILLRLVASWDLKRTQGACQFSEGNDPLKVVPFWPASYPAYRLHMGFENPTPFFARSCACIFNQFVFILPEQEVHGFRKPDPLLCSFLCIFNQFVFILPEQEVHGFRKPDTLLCSFLCIFNQFVFILPGQEVHGFRKPDTLLCSFCSRAVPLISVI